MTQDDMVAFFNFSSMINKKYEEDVVKLQSEILGQKRKIEELESKLKSQEVK